jgi:membrane protease YdiL (CAAX protease family)
MTSGGAATWALATIIVFWFLAGLVAPIKPDLVIYFLCEAIALLGGLALILRVHGPARAQDDSARTSALDFLGLRGAHLAFYPLAILTGIAIHFPVEAIFAWIERRWPSPPSELAKMFLDAGLVKQVVVASILVALGPLVEELFFRGALFRPLRRQSGAIGTLAVTSITFAVSHYAPQTYLPIALVGLALGVARLASGSLLPPLVMHGVFNAISLYGMITAPPGTTGHPPESAGSPLWMTIAGTAVTVALLFGFWALGARSHAARRAKELDTR